MHTKQNERLSSFFFTTFNRLIETPDRKKIRTFFYQLINAQLENEDKLFSSIYAKVHYLFDANSNEDLLAVSLFILRELKNKELKTDALLKSIEFLMLYFFKKSEDNSKIKCFIENHNLPANPVHIHNDRAIVIDVSDILRDDKNQIYCDVFLDCETYGLVRLRCWDHSQQLPGFVARKFHLLKKAFRPYQTIYVQKLRRIKFGWYSTTAETRISIEPDYLVNVTSIAECFYFDFETKSMKANPNLFFLSLIETTEPSTAILRGKLINDYFDALIANPAIDEQEFFDTFIRQNVLYTLPFDMQKIYRIGGEVMQFIRPGLEDFALQYRDYDCLTEPTFYSEKYGLLGRLDLLIRANQKLDIVELKSGKPPRKYTWANNRMQVIGYNLLLQSTFENRQGNASIFYCRAEEDPVRNVYATEALEQQFLMVRNFIMTKLFDIAEGKESLFSLCASDNFGHHPPFKGTFIELLKKLRHNISREEKEYVDSFSKFIIRELITAKVGVVNLREKQNFGFSKLWRLPLEEKKSSSFQQLTIQNIGSSRIVLARHEKNTIVNLREGDIVLLYKHGTPPLRQQIFRGMITYLESSEITVQLWNHQIDENWFSKTDKWVLEGDFMEQNLTVLLQSFVPFLKSSSSKRALLLGYQEPNFKPIIYEGDGSTTPKQKKIISQALSAEDYLLIQGPPGTGKTSAILKNIVSELYFNPENKDIVFVLAYTNRAVEEISAKLANADIRFVRLGRADTKESLYGLSHRYEFHELRMLLAETRVFVSTIASFQSNFSTIAQVYSLDVVIVDEASQLIEPHLIGILSTFKKFIMIGDHKQLPAVVLQNETRIKSALLQQIGFQNSKEPIFERLWQQMEAYGNCDACVTLVEHFRMHADIASLINNFYNNQLEAHDERQLRALPKAISDLHSRVIFMESRTDTRENFAHLYEAEIIRDIIPKLRAVYKANEIGIVTPWRTQIALLRDMLKTINQDDIYIDTVERFQGSEKDVIIFSFALNHPHQIALMQTLDRSGTIDRKLNVAVSRAKEQLILVGDPKILSKNNIFRSLMKSIKDDFLWITSGNKLENEPRI